MVNTYVAIDVETTGLEVSMEDVIEIGLLVVRDGMIEKEYQTFVRSGRILSDRIIELTGITQEQVDGGITPKEAIEEVCQLTKGLPLLGHQILFDYAFLKRMAMRERLPFERNGIDTLKIARICLPEVSNKKLITLCHHYGIELAPHRALEDARATHYLYSSMVDAYMTNSFTQEGLRQDIFEQKPLLYKIKKESPATTHQKERLQELIERHEIRVDYEIENLTRNQASRYMDKILATYGR